MPSPKELKYSRPEPSPDVWFVTLAKFRRKPTKADLEAQDKRWAEAEK